jgi:hypothetical protein
MKELMAWAPTNLGDAAMYAGAIWIQPRQVVASRNLPFHLANRILGLIGQEPAKSRAARVADLERLMAERDLLPHGLGRTLDPQQSVILMIEENQILREVLSLMMIPDQLPTVPLTRDVPRARQILENDSLESWVENLIVP